MNEKDIIQEEQYEFPYHFIPEIEDSGAIVTNRFLQWSMMYLSYINFVRDEVLQSDAKNVLDVGCGDGRMVYELERNDSTRRYVGIDISERALHFARGFAPLSEFKVFDIIESPLDEQFDTCTYIETIEHIEPSQIETMLKNIAASLKPGGVMYLTTPTTNVPTANKHYQHFTRELIEEYISDYFTIAEVRYFNVENWLSKLLARLLVNKLLTVNPSWYRKIIFNLYMKHCFHGTETTGSRIYIKAIKK
jgi:2-polyprenyl-3-methyl-5-hydroxy-6-metoxy-1,4-benzoquinol methylase